MSSNESRVILPFTLQDPSHPTTPEEAGWYEYLKRSHCHRCPEQADCDAEDFMSCEMPRLRKFFKCNCFVCIDEKKLRKIIQSYQDTPKTKKQPYRQPDYYEETFLETNM
jgi:hypothetical protein